LIGNCSRAFEIEHFWKRATYFWGYQGVIFAALGLILKNSGPTNNNCSAMAIPVALCILGILTAIANSLSAIGSKFWQENWEQHIDMLEDDFEGRIYKTVWLKNGNVSFSVSKLTITLNYIFVIFWLFVTFCVVSMFANSQSVAIDYNIPLSAKIAAIVVSVITGSYWLYSQKSRLRASHPKHDGSHGDPFNFMCGKRPPAPASFIRRYAPPE
jgi:hypothetical protein